MTIVEPDPVVTPMKRAERPRRDPISDLPAWARFSLYATVLVLILTIAEQVTDQTRLTSANTWASALQLTVPIALAGLGGLWAERAGIINIGLEGMMILGTWLGAWGGIEFGPWTGVALGVVGGALGGLLHAIATVGFGVDHIVSGVVINILAAGTTQFLNLETYDSTNQSPPIPDNVAEIRIPGLNDVFGGITGNLTDSSALVWLLISVVLLVLVARYFHPGDAEDDGDDGGARLDGPPATTGEATGGHDDEERGARVPPAVLTLLRPVALGALVVLVGLCLIELAPYLDDQQRFFISEVGRIIEGLTKEVSLIVVIAVLAFPATAFILWRTKFGLRLRSCGEDPVAAESLGINVYLMKVIAVVVSGGLAGLGGVSLVYLFAQKYQSGQTNGRGYIGLAANIFGNWRPGGLALGAGLFGFTDALSLQSGGTTRSLLLVLAMGTVLLVARAAWTRRWRAAVFTGVAGLAAYLWFRAIAELPGEIVVFLPHITTLLVLTFASQRLRPPAAIGQSYRRGDSG